MRGAAWVAALALGAVAGDVRADIYSYVDADGVVHYTNVPADPQFALLLRGEDVPEFHGEPSPAWHRRAVRFDAVVDRVAGEQHVDPALVRAVIAVESAFDPQAVSRRGAQGLMQLHPRTARRLGVADPLDPEQNVRGGTRYLRELLLRFDDLELALAAYNAGEGAVERYGRRIPPFRETQAYVPAVLRIYRELGGSRSPLDAAGAT